MSVVLDRPAQRTQYFNAPVENTTNWRQGLAAIGVGFMALAPTAVVGRPAETQNQTESAFHATRDAGQNKATTLARMGVVSEEQEAPATSAIRELKDWLALSDSELSDLTGISRRSITNWRSGMAAYGSTTRNLFGLHALVSSLRLHLGNQGALLWLVTGHFDGLSSLELLAQDPNRLDRVLVEAAPLIFSSEPRAMTAYVADEIREQEMLGELRQVSGAIERREVRRPRRVPRQS